MWRARINTVEELLEIFSKLRNAVCVEYAHQRMKVAGEDIDISEATDDLVVARSAHIPAEAISSDQLKDVNPFCRPSHIYHQPCTLPLLPMELLAQLKVEQPKQVNHLKESFSPTSTLNCCVGKLEEVTIMDGLLLRFLEVRKFHFEQAAVRFLKLRDAIITHDLSLNVNGEGVEKGIRTGLLHCRLPCKETNEHLMLYALPRRLDWKHVTVTEMKRGWFYLVMSYVLQSFYAQSVGCILQNSMLDFGMGNVCMEFHHFLGTMMQQCLPARISAGFIGNQPFIFGTILWPLMSRMLSGKIRSRLKVVGSDYKTVLEFFNRSDHWGGAAEPGAEGTVSKKKPSRDEGQEEQGAVDWLASARSVTLKELGGEVEFPMSKWVDPTDPKQKERDTDEAVWSEVKRLCALA